MAFIPTPTLIQKLLAGAGSKYGSIEGQDDGVYLRINADTPCSALTLSLSTPERVQELTGLLRRGLNCMEPEKSPAWVVELLDVLDRTPRPNVPEQPGKEA